MSNNSMMKGCFRGVDKREYVKSDYLTHSQVCSHLGISPATLERWYQWYFDPEYEKPSRMPALPYIHKVDYNVYAPRLYRKDELKMIVRFAEWLPRGRQGVMSKKKKPKTKMEVAELKDVKLDPKTLATKIVSDEERERIEQHKKEGKK